MTRVNMFPRQDIFVPRGFGQLVDSLINDARLHESGFKPNADVLEFSDRFELQLALPGFAKEDIKAELDGHNLTITGERKRAEGENAPKYLIQENAFGKFSRTFTLPKNASVEGIEARFENGLLIMAIAKQEKLNKVIEVK